MVPSASLPLALEQTSSVLGHWQYSTVLSDLSKEILTLLFHQATFRPCDGESFQWLLMDPSLTFLGPRQGRIWKTHIPWI